MRHGPQACIGQRDLVFIGFQIGLQLGEGGGGKVFARQQRHGHIRHLADVLEVFQRVVTELFVQCGRGRHAHVVQEEGVTVGGCARHLACADGAARTYRVLHQHGLAQRLAHRYGDHAGHHVGGATGGEGHDQADGFVGISRLRENGCADRQRCHQGRSDQRNGSFQFCVHRVLQRLAVQIMR